jgi:hypothetical protein
MPLLKDTIMGMANRAMVKEAKKKKDDEKVRKAERENARLDQRKWCQGSKEEEDEEEEDDDKEETMRWRQTMASNGTHRKMMLRTHPCHS